MAEIQDVEPYIIGPTTSFYSINKSANRHLYSRT